MERASRSPDRYWREAESRLSSDSTVAPAAHWVRHFRLQGNLSGRSLRIRARLLSLTGSLIDRDQALRKIAALRVTPSVRQRPARCTAKIALPGTCTGRTLLPRLNHHGAGGTPMILKQLRWRSKWEPASRCGRRPYRFLENGAGAKKRIPARSIEWLFLRGGQHYGDATFT